MTEAEQPTPWEHLYLPKSHTWTLQTMRGVPAQPKTGDRGPVIYAIHDLVDAGGMLEYARGALLRNIGIAQQEYEALTAPLGEPVDNWTGLSTRTVYYAFYTAVTSTRAVRDRFELRLKNALLHDRPLWNELQKIRNQEAGRVFEDAHHLAGCYLHAFTPPYPNFGAKVVDGVVIYPVVDNINTKKKQEYPEILRDNFELGRHASAVIDQYWNSVSNFIDRLVEIFYPSRSPGNGP